MTTSAAYWKRERLIPLSWDDFDAAIEAAASTIADFAPDLILGIARGGLVPAVALAHFFHDAEFRVCSVARTKSDDAYAAKEAPTLRWPTTPQDIRGRRVLVVDDVVGTGASLKLVRSRVAALAPADVLTYAIAVNTAVSPRPDIYSQLIDDWIVFPWERTPGASA
ncbi:MAG: uncharacterized protein QOK28_3125 [Actinomycetota bacterium]|jgi:hypoxanthine phosphoribosyltransferase